MAEYYDSIGLRTDEVSQLQQKWGPNEIRSEKPRSPFLVFFEQFKSPLVLVLLFACGLSAILGEWYEALAIATVLLLNAVIGFFQEYRAETAVLALKKMTSPRARVIRDEIQSIIPARDVVPGDILLLEPGDIVAADASIISSSRLQLNEAILTGESFPVSRGLESGNDLSHTVFMGTAVATGTAKTLVTNIGMNTNLGKIAHLMTHAELPQTPLQVQLKRVGKMLLLLCLLVICGVALAGLLQKREWLELLIFSISLAVAAVPEGLPTIVTVSLALAVQRMAKRHALVRKLPSVETLGSVSVICTDKTGTLTTGNMRVREIHGSNPKEALRTAVSCCDAELSKDGISGTGDPTEIAILIAAKEYGLLKDEIEEKHPRLLTEPFDPLRKRMAVYRSDGTLYVKGALEAILPLCRSDQKNFKLLETKNIEMTSRGLRVLALAQGTEKAEKDLKLIGLLGIADPPRAEAIQAISETRSAGITPIMITGDHPLTAEAIARELGLVGEGETTSERVYARATPHEKLDLVRKLKKTGAIVAMTGDGVNDAPALREAHIGIAMGRTGTEVTRQSADLILTDDNFSTIVAAVKEGRGIYQNIQKAITYLLTGNFGEVLVVVGASFMGLPLPFLAAHLLWINLVTDALPALALIVDPVADSVMDRPPRKPTEELLGRSQWTRIGLVGLLEAAIVLSVFWISLDSNGVDKARSLAFSTLVFSQLWRSFSARSEKLTFWETDCLSNLWLLAVVVVTGTLQLSLHFLPLAQAIFGLAPLDIGDFAKLVGTSLITTTVIELRKILIRQ